MAIQIAFVILNAIKDNDSPLRYRCMVCRNPFPIRPNTRETIVDMRSHRRAYVVLCDTCYKDVTPPTNIGPQLAGGTNEMRRIMGLRELQ